jgi:hypothetical protein
MANMMRRKVKPGLVKKMSAWVILLVLLAFNDYF